MNEQAQQYWNDFWKGKTPPALVKAEQFGPEGSEWVDKLAARIMEGKKTATCSGYDFYQWENEPIPVVGQHTIILNSRDEPVAIIKTTDVRVIPMNEVTPEFAAAEGEGDLSHAFWWEAHEAAFTADLAEYGKEFSETMPLVCERFELVDVKNK